MKILIIRNDKIGDFVLSLPVFSLIKANLPSCQLHALVPNYTRDLAEFYHDIDKTLLDPGTSAGFKKQFNLLKVIRSEKYDAVITLFSTSRIGFLLALSGIKYRLAPATKLAQVFYNNKLGQRRSKSLKPEFEYNLDLGIKYLNDLGIDDITFPQKPYIQFDTREINEHRLNFCKTYNLKDDSRFIFIHPGTGGSATNLSIKQYATLAMNIHISNNHIFVITAGPNEIDIARELSQLLTNIPHIVYHSTEGLISFTKTIQLCDVFISASTGPLHIAGALDCCTAAFYQRRRSATALRWQTLNSEGRRLAFSPPKTADESDMHKIDVLEAANIITATYLTN